VRPRRTSLVVPLALAALLGGCTITRMDRGAHIRAEPDEALVAGRTTKAEVLRLFGPPAGVARQRDGDLFLYQFVRRHGEKFQLEEPVITNVEVFTWSRTREREDRLVILFDRDGVVREHGFSRGTEELRGF
jgi:outer membrane protein assembly factor BamE (lipoprotein component of BamABCDE complex)